MSELSLEQQLENARIGYSAALDALPYMPVASKPYTRQTANRYLDDIIRLKKEIDDAKR